MTAPPELLYISAVKVLILNTRKINIFRENPKKLKVRYLEIRCSSEKGPPGTLNGPIGPIFLDRSQDTPQT